TLESTAIINESTVKGNLDTTQNNFKDNKKEENELENKIKKEPLLERFPLIDLEKFLKQNSVNMEIPLLKELETSDAQVPAFDVDENQYKFVIDDLEKASKNKNVDWIFIMFHKPMYSPLSKQVEEYIVRDKYQPLFDKYDVDLVISGHNHIYSRTLPLSFNKIDISEPIVDKKSSSNSVFSNPNGTTFLVVGTGGDELYRITEKPYYIANQYNEGFGFVDLNIDDKKLDGKFYDINLNCQMGMTEKKGKEKIDFESCVPATTTTINQNNLKVIDQFTIDKL
ncbi:MAG TPA: metallophosphoesterase family protein, partial [Nitrososphaeraceae archaeon]|nr:metallophosphoesterase family protein [Nitrososphaeraceae archaeon]